MSTTVKKIGEIADVKGGKRLPKGKSVLDEPTAHAYLRVVDFADGSIDRSNLKYIDEESFEKIRRYTIHDSDIYIGIASTIGCVGIVPEDLSGASLTENAAKITNISDEVNHRYLMYYLRGSVGQGQISNRTGGTSQPKLALYRIADIDFPCPPLPTQERVAAVLSTYDDLIENNRRRIQLLEESARLLYKEWFIHLRFPGHEHVKVIDGVPEGWCSSTIKELADVYRGKSYKSSELREQGGRDFVNLKCIKRYGGFRSSGLKRFEGDHKDHHRIVTGDIVMAVTDMTRDAMIVAQAGRVPRSIDEGAIFSMDIVKIVPRDGIEPSWLYLLFRHSDFSFAVREHATGTNVLHLKPKHIEDWSTPIPPVALCRAFADVANPILGQIDVFEMQSQFAAQARDILLPKLMNREISV